MCLRQRLEITNCLTNEGKDMKDDDIDYFNFTFCKKCDGTDCPQWHRCNSYLLKKREEQFIKLIGNYELFD